MVAGLEEGYETVVKIFPNPLRTLDFKPSTFRDARGNQGAKVSAGSAIPTARRWSSRDRSGRMTSMTESVLLIRINRTNRPNMSDDALYEATRKWWVLNPDRAPDRAFAVYAAQCAASTKSTIGSRIPVRVGGLFAADRMHSWRATTSAATFPNTSREARRTRFDT